MTFLELHPLTEALLPAALELDRRCFGGLWTLDGYRRELESPNSELLGLQGAGGRGQGAGEEDAGTREQGDAGTSIQNSKFKIQNFPSPPVPRTPYPVPSLIGLGCYWAILEEAHITILAVDPDHQRQGVGQALLLALLDSARQRGLERSTLEVRISNRSALSLYEKFGFREAGRRKRYYQDTGEDALVLWRGGLQSAEFCGLLQDWQRQVSDRLYHSGWRLSEDWKPPYIKKPYLTCESISVNNLPSG